MVRILLTINLLSNLYIYLVQKSQDDQMTTVQEVAITGYNSYEDHASDILRSHYGTLSLSLQHPIRIAELLCGERVISETTLSIVKNRQCSQSEEKAMLVVFKAVRHAVRTNYQNLILFAGVLLKISSNVPCAKDILMSCREY